MNRTKVLKCSVCGTSFSGRRDAKYCSPKCRQKANRAAPRDRKQGGGIESGGNPKLDSKPVTETKLILSDPRFAQTNEKGFVLCARCGRPTRLAPVIVETPDPLILQVVPVYCFDCSFSTNGDSKWTKK